MTAAVITAWLHYVAFMFMAGGAVAQIYLLKQLPSFETVKLIARVDRLYGIAAAAVLLTGFARIPIAHGGKSLTYYLHNGAFHAALAVFLLAAALSLVPTIRYVKWARAASAGTLPAPQAWGGTRKLVHIQLTALVLVALLMPIMARGVPIS